jgi:hypothetical protein
MQYSIVIEQANKLAPWAAVALGFFIPMSTSMASILLAVIVILWLLSVNFKSKYSIIRSNPVAISALIVSGLYFLGLLYGNVSKDSVSSATRFLSIPLLIPLFLNLKIRRYALWGFLSAMFITLILSYLAWFDLLPKNDILRRTTSPYFALSEFHDGQTVEALYGRIRTDIGSVALIDADKTVGGLNEILKIPDLYDRLSIGDRGIHYSPEIMDLVNITSDYRTGRKFADLNGSQKTQITRLNRLFIEETYPHITPKSQREHKVDVAVIQNKITQNFLMAFAAFLFMIYARFTKNRVEKIILTALAGFAFFNVLFVVGGKTGHVVILVLAIYFFIDWFKLRKGIFVSFVIVALLGGIVYLFPSNQLYIRTISVIDQFSQWHPEKADESSTGQRLEFYYNSLKIIRENPLFGVGTGNFANAYAEKVKGSAMDRQPT